jgi:hypothetical protein
MRYRRRRVGFTQPGDGAAFGAVWGQHIRDQRERDAQAAATRRRHRLPQGECASCDEFGTGMGPSHDASARCESGKREHCSCNACF